MENEEIKLKARAYELLVMYEQIQKELSIINQQLAKLSEEKKKQPEDAEKDA